MTDTRVPAILEATQLGKVSSWLSQKGWSEAASGNISIRFDELPSELRQLEAGQPRPLPLPTPNLSGRYLLVTSAGSRARDLEGNLERNAGLFQILQGGREMACLWGNPRATSELAAHLAIQHKLVEVRPQERATLHTHPPKLIALTHLPQLQDSRALSDALLGMQSEARLLFPQGLQYVPYSLAGSVELANRSAEAAERSRLMLWHMHGALATGESLPLALDLLEYVDKMAEIYWIVRSASAPPRYTAQ